LHVRNVFTHKISKITVNLEIRLLFRPDLSFQIRQNPAPAGLEKNKSGTALTIRRSVRHIQGGPQKVSCINFQKSLWSQ